MRVHFHTKSGLVDGIFGWPAIHVRKDEDPKIQTHDLSIDV
jgi:putative aminopeptidase FrvX